MAKHTHARPLWPLLVGTSQAVLIIGLTLFLPSTLRAEAEALDESSNRLQLPPPPDERRALLAGELHLTAVFPLATESLCPEGPACVFGGGGGIGITLERRWPSRLAAFIGYDAWFIDGNGVYELGVVHTVRLGGKYFLFEETIWHPFVSIAAGALIFGDTLRIAAVGAAADVALGLEVEMTETLSLVVALPWRIFTTTSFVTPRDMVSRAEEGGFNTALSFQVGLSLIETP